MLSTINFTQTTAYQKLLTDKKRLETHSISSLFQSDKERQKKYSLYFNDIFIDYSKKHPR